MSSINFNKYLERFEAMVGIGVVAEVIGREMPVSVREGKLYYSRFARFLGTTIDHHAPFAIDYYGYFKKSSGLRKYFIEVQEDMVDQQIKHINTTIVKFNSIRVEDIKALTDDQYLLWGFIEFKDVLLEKRGLGNKRRRIAV